MVQTTEIRPSVHLQPYIQRYAYREFDTGTSELIRPLPALCEFLLNFNLGNSSTIHIKPSAMPGGPMNAQDISRTSSIISGINNHYNGILVFKGRFRIFSIQFSPKGFFGIFNIPAQSFTNQTIESDAVFPKSFAVLNQQLLEAISVQEMVQYSEQFLTASLLRNKKSQYFRQIDAAAYTLLYGSTAISVEQLAAGACMSMKTFERKFLQEVGVVPKLYARMARFNRAVAMKMKNNKQSWTDIAHACGYYDQTHLVKEFRALASNTPTTFFNATPPPHEQLVVLP